MDQNQLEQIGSYVKNNIGQWLADQNILPFPSKERVLERDLLERMVTIEQQLKFQNDKIEMMMERSDRRFTEMQTNINQRFESMDKRFEDIQSTMDKRFESMDKRFESMDKRFEDMQLYMDKRFESVQHTMDQRFNAVDKRFNRLYVFLTGLFLTMLGGFIPLIIKAL